MSNVQQIINDCKAMMSAGLKAPKHSIDVYLKYLDKYLDKYSDSCIGRSGNSRKNEMMSRPIIMYLWYLIKQGKIVTVDSVYKSTNSISGKFLFVPMYDDEGKPTKNAIIPIIAEGEGSENGEYQKIMFVDKLSDFEVLPGKFIQRTYNEGMCIEECTELEYLENVDKFLAFDTAFRITKDNCTYLANPFLTSHTIITITEANGKHELYQIVNNPHGKDELNDPNVKKASDGYITQDIIIPLIKGIGSQSKYVNKDGKATAYRASIPVSRFMALASLFVSHELFKGDLAKEPNNDMWKRKARVKEWGMIEGFNKSIVEPFEKLYPNEDSLKVLTLAIKTYIFTILGSEAMKKASDNDKANEDSKAAEAYKSVIDLYCLLFGDESEYNLIYNTSTPHNVLNATKTWTWLSYFLSMQSSWNNVPYVNHKDLRRSHNTMYNLEFTCADFNDAHGALVGAFASLSDGEKYVKVATVPSRQIVNGKTVYTTKKIQVFKNHYGISAYILDDFDKYMLNEGATHFRRQFINQLHDIAVINRKQINSPTPKYLVIAPDQVAMFKRFLEGQYGYGTDAYWKLV